MAMPPPPVMQSAMGAATGSNFLTGPIGYGIGAAAGNIAGQALSSNAVNFRGKYARNQLSHQRNVWQAERDQISPNMAAQMKALDESGLHRLAALGISIPSSSAPNNQPMIPGQSDYGSSVSEGINTALDVARSDRSGRNQQAIQGMRLEEQKLRNDYLRTQIQASQMKTMTAMANSTRPPIPLNPNASERMKRHYLSRNKKSYSGGPGTPQEVLEKEFGEWADYFPSIIGNVWDSYKKDFRNVFDIKPGGAGPDFLRNPPKTK